MSASDQNQDNAKWDIGSDYPAPNNAAIGSPSLEQQTAASNQSQCGNPHNQQRVPTAAQVKAEYNKVLHGIRYAFLLIKVAHITGEITDSQAFLATQIAVDRVQEVVDSALGEDDTAYAKFMADVDSLVKIIKDNGIV